MDFQNLIVGKVTRTLRLILLDATRALIERGGRGP
jgi:hypothetical protein